MITLVCVSKFEGEVLLLTRYERKTDKIAKLMGSDKLKATHRGILENPTQGVIEKYRMTPSEATRIQDEKSS